MNRIEKRRVCGQFSQWSDKEGSIESELVLIAVGRKPNTDCITPDSKIVLTDSKQVKVDRYLQTSVDGVYAIET